MLTNVLFSTRKIKRPSLQIKITGLVQGVGFRPAVYNCAVSLGLTGYVLNDTEGVTILLQGADEKIEAFMNEIQHSPPPLSHIAKIETETVYEEEYASFSILESGQSAKKNTSITPDAATCALCEAEMFDKNDRRYMYPFINCTNCGPRYSIVETVPYDRANTVMSKFQMCEPCQKEYLDPTNRRFHAQPNACAVCGPNVYFRQFKGTQAIIQAALKVNMGGILALKGLGGYHIILDATNSSAVSSLRQLKGRHSKPFAVMCRDIDILKEHCKITREEEKMLTSSMSPIVIVDNFHDEVLKRLANPVGNDVGVMLPYTPLHKLLFRYLNTDFVIATSGNLQDEPIAKDVEGAEAKLHKFTDNFLHHNRDIRNRSDDSLLKVISIDNEPSVYMYRRARGFAPAPIYLSKKLDKPILGLGAHQKTTITVAKDNYAFVSQYIGDLDTSSALEYYREVYDNMVNLFDAKPDLLINDMHPAYFTSTFSQTDTPRCMVQHHEAHLAACMAENGLADDVIGVVFDGTGFGRDGSVWGGEFFSLMDGKISRRYHMEYIPLTGGDVAIREPARVLLNYLQGTGLADRWGEFVCDSLNIPPDVLMYQKRMIKAGINTVQSSSAGRFFESIGSIITGVPKNEFEAHTAILMEQMANGEECSKTYDYDYKDGVLHMGNIIDGVLNDLSKGVARKTVAAKFHNTLASQSADVCKSIADHTGLKDVVLSGGVMQNTLFLKILVKKLQNYGLRPHIHKYLPPNDGCISLGQVYHYLMDYREEAQT